MSAYFAQLEVVGAEGAQAIDVLVDTGSSHLLLPSSLCQPDSRCSTFAGGAVLQRLDLAAANATAVRCDDPRCQVSAARHI